MNRAIVSQDLVIGKAIGQMVGIVIPPHLSGFPNARLRYDEVAIVDADLFDDFFIDEFGQKHIIQHAGAWQSLMCQWDDVIILDDVIGWRLKTSADYTADAEELERNQIWMAYKGTEEEPVTVAGIIYRGGFENLNRIDLSIRVTKMTESVSVDLFDIYNVEHTMGLLDADDVFLVLGEEAERKLADAQIAMSAVLFLP